MKSKQPPVPGASAPAPALARTRERPTAKRTAKRTLPIGPSPASAAPSCRATPALTDEGEPSAVTLAAASTHGTNELVFVDSTTPRYQSLIDDMRTAAAEGRRLEFVLIDAWRDGVHKISETLIQKKDLDAIHIVAHARDGAVQLGSAQLDVDILLKRAAQITAWCDALSADGDILLYGCDLAANPEGKALLEALSRLTGADLAASEDPSGAAAKGEDWTVEFKPGAIETPIVASRDEMRDADEPKGNDEHRASWVLDAPTTGGER